MKKDKRYFPVKIVYEIKLNKEELVAMQNENLKYSYKNMPREVECYKFSNYLIDANKGRFKSVVRIIAFMLKFVKNLRKKTRPLQDLKQMSKIILFTDNELKKQKLLRPQKGNIGGKENMKVNTKIFQLKLME